MANFVLRIIILFCMLANLSSIAADRSLAAISVGQVLKEYPEKYLKGADVFSKKTGMNTIIISCDNNDLKQIKEIKRLIDRTGKKIIFFVDSYDVNQTTKIANIMDSENIYWISWLAKSNKISVMDYKYWVSHISFNFSKDSNAVAEELAKAMGGAGDVVAITGPRIMKQHNGKIGGLLSVIQNYPELKLIDTVKTDGNRDSSYEQIENLLRKYPNVTGVWTALDSIALGVVDYLRVKKLQGKIKVVSIGASLELLNDIKNGEITATVYYDSVVEIVDGLTLVNKVNSGELQIDKLSKEQREHKIKGQIVNSENVNTVLKEYMLEDIGKK